MGIESEWRMKVLRMEGYVINNMIIFIWERTFFSFLDILIWLTLIL